MPEKRKDEKYRRSVWRPTEGRAWNRLRSYPPNKGCFCGSGAKAKKCCMPKLLPTMPIAEAKKIDANWEKILTGRTTITLDDEGKENFEGKKLEFVKPAVRPPTIADLVIEGTKNERDDTVSEHPLSGPDAPRA